MKRIEKFTGESYIVLGTTIMEAFFGKKKTCLACQNLGCANCPFFDPSGEEVCTFYGSDIPRSFTEWAKWLDEDVEEPGEK